MNTVSLNNASYYCYWLLNNPAGDKYVLFEGTEETVNGEQSRVLQEGEYLYYTNLKLTNMVILGAGTKVVRKSSFQPWSVDIVAADLIFEEGSRALTNSWFTIPNGNYLDVVENQIITVPADFDVKFTLTDYSKLSLDKVELKIVQTSGSVVQDWAEWVCNIDTKKLLAHPEDFTNLGGVAGDATIEFEYDGYWTCNGTALSTNWANGLDTYGITNITDPGGSYVSQAGSLYYLYLKVSVSNDWSITLSNQETDVSSYSIQYKSAKSNLWTTLPQVTLGDLYNWKATSILNIDSSPTVEQKLLSGQTLTFVMPDADVVQNVTLEGCDPSTGELYDFPESGTLSNSYKKCFYWQYLGLYYAIKVVANSSVSVSSLLLYYNYEDNTVGAKPTYPQLTITTYTPSAYSPKSPTNPSYDPSIAQANYIEVNNRETTQPEYWNRFHHVINYPVCFYTSMTIQASVAMPITTYYDDEDLNRTYMDAYVFSEIKGADDADMITREDGSLLVQVYPQAGLMQKISIPFNVPTGTYLLPVTLNTTRNVTCYIKNAGVDCYPINNKLDYTIEPNKTTYVVLNVTSNMDWRRLNICFSAGYDECSVTLGNLYKYIQPELTIFGTSSNNAFNLIHGIMMAYDKYRYFDYTYIVDEDVNIPNPLLPDTFFNSNHIFNAYTIAQFDTNTSNLGFNS